MTAKYMGILNMQSGYYWLRRRRNGEWTVAHNDGSNELEWTFIGSLHLASSAEIFEPDEDGEIAFDLGPRIATPD